MGKISVMPDGSFQTDDPDMAVALSRRLALGIDEKHMHDRMRASYQEILATGVDPMRVQLVESAEPGGNRTWYFELRREQLVPALFDAHARDRVAAELERWLDTQRLAHSDARKSLAVDFALHCLHIAVPEVPRIWFGGRA